MVYNAIVIGAGGVGSAALYHLASRGARVLGLDRFPPGHDRGSSHGRTRIIRQAYFEHSDYVPLLRRAYELWRQLSELSGRPLIHEIGLLQAGPPDSAVLAGVRRSAAEHGLTVEELSAAAAAERFRGFRLPSDWIGLLEPAAGYLDVEECVLAHLDAATKHGAELRTGVTVGGWRRDGDGFVVSTDAGDFRAERLVIAAGPWAADLLNDLPVQPKVRRAPQYWYPAPAPYRAESGCPCFLFDTPAGIFYGIPAIDDYGLKVAQHTGRPPVSDPLTVDRRIDPAEQARVEAFLAEHLPGMPRTLLHHSVCLYTMTPDEHFIVDRTPGEPPLAFAAGLSGHGFKFTGVLGEILADLALDGRTTAPIGFLSADRFRAGSAN